MYLWKTGSPRKTTRSRSSRLTAKLKAKQRRRVRRRWAGGKKNKP